ncbi:nucleotide-diphospho-sugar transferase [Blyttiomyces helicus]|uniref:Nucleotide-diphospho-sugar transferase n=1 Tax=Blyttiomyces helicus TaxID=388810 RepID=A0A4P9W114_9FUNG|nr:nucleotide-diphospho-sugar transferase [Blyttiomyces helicus]|eukprot:RKO85794.1 nucleotide-diphospho-sugar transferase [Blyttiomyces helicus]
MVKIPTLYQVVIALHVKKRQGCTKDLGFNSECRRAILEAARALAALHLHTNLPNTRIPNIIHQTWSSRRKSTIPPHVNDSVTSWRSANSGSVHLFWDDADMDEMVRVMYPAWYGLYRGLPRAVMRADVFRYLVLLGFGGVYADVDTKCLRPVEKWVEPKDIASWTYPRILEGASEPVIYPTVGDRTVAFIVGIETDVPRSYGLKWQKYYARPMQMCQWTMAAAPGHPILSAVTASIFKTVSDAKASGEPLGRDPTRVTGPQPWTFAIYDAWKMYGIEEEALREFGETGRVSGDMLVLPITAFR